MRGVRSSRQNSELSAWNSPLGFANGKRRTANCGPDRRLISNDSNTDFHPLPEFRCWADSPLPEFLANVMISVMGGGEGDTSIFSAKTPIARAPAPPRQTLFSRRSPQADRLTAPESPSFASTSKDVVSERPLCPFDPLNESSNRSPLLKEQAYIFAALSVSE